jgi:chromate transporter
MYQSSELLALTALFLKLGCTAFGGPAAHIAMMHAEVVTRRKWLTDEKFLDLLGATNLIPGPNSTEMAIHIGFMRAGWAGLVVAGACFILPAMLIVTGLAWLYMGYGALPQAAWLLYGIKPVVIAIIAQALWTLAGKAIKGWWTALVGLTSLGLFLAGVNELALLAAAGLFVMLISNVREIRAALANPLNGLILPAGLLSGVGAGSTPFSLPVLFFTFLKIGSVLYGSGYVLLAFLHADFVTRLGWLTDQQLLDAIAVGQITPGPVFTTATFIGYLLAGLPGALLATLGIFLPAFVFVAISNPFIHRLRNSTWLSGLLVGVNVASLGLMAGVVFQLSRISLIDPLTIILAISSLALLIRKINPVWLILAGGLIGLLRALFIG